MRVLSPSRKLPLPPIDWPWVNVWGMLILFCILAWVAIVTVVFDL